LVVDRFYDVLVIQISTAGMEKYISQIIEALDTVIKPKAILLKNDGKMREVEGLDNYIQWTKGDAGEFAFLEENGVKFVAPIMKGQKTGWFYDQRLNRARLKAYVKNKRVLDVFSYIGGWGIQAAAFGAKETWLTDVSAFALDLIKQQAELNNLQNIHTIQGNAFEVLEQLKANGEKFDLVILDPPAFIPRRKDLKKGLAAYQKINQLALRLLPAQGGTLISASCSMHLQAHELRDILQICRRKINRHLQILEQGHQGPDHPVHPAIPETEYLKAFILFSFIT
jgi:23S rRNA (cytosine1962-C5)-methyltransferase